MEASNEGQICILLNSVAKHPLAAVRFCPKCMTAHCGCRLHQLWFKCNNTDNVTGIVSFVKETMMLLGSFLSVHAYQTGNFHKVLIANYLV